MKGFSLNSTMVRLKREQKMKKYEWFQNSLNSTMVRLKLVGFKTNKTLMDSLNSTMVRLKLNFKNYYLHFLICLNSTMVRLKHNSGVVYNKADFVSIPLWFD